MLWWCPIHGEIRHGEAIIGSASVEIARVKEAEDGEAVGIGEKEHGA
jgi:hypothetical protein